MFKDGVNNPRKTERIRERTVTFGMGVGETSVGETSTSEGFTLAKYA